MAVYAYPGCLGDKSVAEDFWDTAARSVRRLSDMDAPWRFAPASE